MFKSWVFKICASKKYFKIITENYVRSRFCWEKIHQNRTRIDFGIMFRKILVLYEIYSKKLVTEYFLHVSVYIGLPCSSSNVKVYSTIQQLYSINKWFDKFNKTKHYSSWYLGWIVTIEISNLTRSEDHIASRF